MFKFNKNVELLETVEKQKGQLTRYESRIRDLVSAYKSLLNEKEALEASVKALSASHQGSPRPARQAKSKLLDTNSQRRSSLDSVSKPNEESPSAGSCANDDSQTQQEKRLQEDVSDQGEEEESQNIEEDNADNLIEHLRHQISTLTASLFTVTTEKSKIVATYQAEKRKLNQETEIRLNENIKEVESLKTKNQDLEQELLMTKEKIRTQQKDREEEQSTHSIMLRELQKMLNDERTKNVQLTTDLQESRKMLQKTEAGIKISDAHEEKVKKLTEELEIVNGKLNLVKSESKKPSPSLLKLQKEFVETKASHRIQLEKEQMQTSEAEEYIKQLSQESEERVASLEKQITHLSNQMGGYETSKTRDQIIIQKLKERISQLEAENSILAKQVAAYSSKKFTGNSGSSSSMDTDLLDITEIKNQIIKYKGLLKIAAQKSDESIDVFGWLSALDGREEEDNYQRLYLEAQQELRQCKDEFEKYKVRAQSVLKTKRETNSNRHSVVALTTQQQVQDLKNEIEEIKERHFHLRSYCDGLEERQKKIIKDHEEDKMRQHLTHRKQLENEKELYSAKTLELEHEMRSHRERTVALLAEKDQEIQHLQAYSKACHREYQCEFGKDYVSRISSTSKKDDSAFYGTEDQTKDNTLDSVTEIMSKGTMQDTTMIHFAEQMARKDVSINGLRRHKKQLELQIRQMQDVIMMKDEKNSREISVLQEDIAHLKRNKSREGANLEYLKNVMYQYLTTNRDHSARSRMLHAVTTILQFSPEEVNKVLQSK